MVTYPSLTTDDLAQRYCDYSWMDRGQWSSKTLCPVHKVLELVGGTCVFAQVPLLPESTVIFSVDMGYALRGATPPALDGWEAFWGRDTSGGGHGYLAYGRCGVVTAEDVKSFFETVVSKKESFFLSVEGNNIRVQAGNIGAWIGKGGWRAKALRQLGINVHFHKLVEVGLYLLREVPEDLQREVLLSAVWQGELMSKGSMLFIALDSEGPQWKALKKCLGPSRWDINY